MKKPPVQLIGLDNITVDHDGLQSRYSMHPDYVQEFAEAMVSGSVFPALVVFFDGNVYWLADGFHRYEAARHALIENIRCEVHKGSRRDAIIFSAGANKAFSIPRDTEDKRKASQMLFADGEWFGKDAKQIADYVGVRVSAIHSWRLRYCNDNAIKPLAIDRQKARKVAPAPGPTGAQLAERERIAWEMAKAGATHKEIAAKLGITRQAVGFMLERLEARALGELTVDIQNQLPVAPRSPVTRSPSSPSDDSRPLDDYDPAYPLTSVLRMMVRGSSIDRLERESGVPNNLLYGFARGDKTITLDTADKLAVRFGLILVKEDDPKPRKPKGGGE